MIRFAVLEWNLAMKMGLECVVRERGECILVRTLRFCSGVQIRQLQVGSSSWGRALRDQGITEACRAVDELGKHAP